MHYKIDASERLHCNPSDESSEEDLMGQPNQQQIIEWDWDVEHKDRKREKEADAALHDFRHPFDVDRRLLKDVVQEKMGGQVGRIKFLSGGTFHKAYLVTMAHGQELVARVARRFMPRLKTESEVATMHYLKNNTPIPVPTVFHYDSNPYNRLGGEWILMSKAPGIPLRQVFHSMPHGQLVQLLDNLAALLVSSFAHRFPQLGSLYFGPPPGSSHGATPSATPSPYTAFPFSPTLTTCLSTPRPPTDVHVGPIISWPFFGSNRGDLDLDRGPWSTAEAYFDACAKREIDGVIRENEGKAAPHRLHLDPAEILASRHHHMTAVPGDTSDDSDEYNLEESEEEWEGPGDAMYRDYRRMQRSTFLVAHLTARLELVTTEMQRWKNLMDKLIRLCGADAHKEAFALDCHDLSLDNIFVDAVEHSKITCIIDWESTTTRPLWAAAHIPAFLDSSPFTADLFRQSVKRLATQYHNYGPLAREWLHWESAGFCLRMAHRFVEWDGWEEGLIEEILGPPDAEDEWIKLTQNRSCKEVDSGEQSVSPNGHVLAPSFKRQLSGAAARRVSSTIPFVANEKAKVAMLNQTGDICGGRGGELGRRLEAWLHVTEHKVPKVVVARKDQGWDEDEYDAAGESD